MHKPQRAHLSIE
jgi:hypothetical protein